jgi:hypothetical protein
MFSMVYGTETVHPQETTEGSPHVVIYYEAACWCFFALARYAVAKIACSCSEVVLQTMKNYKAHYSLS